MSMQVIDEDEYTPEVDYGAGTHTFTRDEIGTRYVLLGVRMLVDANDPKDVEAVHAFRTRSRSISRAGRASSRRRIGIRQARRRCEIRCS